MRKHVKTIAILVALYITVFPAPASAAYGTASFHGKDFAMSSFSGTEYVKAVVVCDREDDGATAFVKIQFSNGAVGDYYSNDYGSACTTVAFASSYQIDRFKACESSGPERSYATCSSRWTSWGIEI